eukprot:6183919-Lingulodinium_polyedra.AAC.1
MHLELATADGLDRLVAELSMLAGEKEEDAKRRAVREALFDLERRNGESLAQYSARRDAQFLKAEQFELKLDSITKGMMLEEGARLSAQDERNLRTLTMGSQDVAK